MSTCELSIVIPVVNEAGVIGEVLQNLSWQRGVVFEVIVCDGGSTDATLDTVRELSALLTYPVRIVRCERGRGRQMNAGAEASQGENLLFLHADSLFASQDALRNGLALLAASRDELALDRIAGHFSLSFRRRKRERSFFYYFSECKARLDRPGCTHGDQGFLVSKRVFEDAGPYDETCPVMEDTRFAESIRNGGRWILVPVDLATSARRFEDEGEVPRQALNAVIMILDAVGREDYIRKLPGIYATGERGGRLRISPCLEGIDNLLRQLSMPDRLRFWLSVGEFACGNAWQLALALDVRRCFGKCLPPGEGDYRLLRYFDRYLTSVLKLRCMAFCAAGMAKLLFACIRFSGSRRGW